MATPPLMWPCGEAWEAFWARSQKGLLNWFGGTDIMRCGALENVPAHSSHREV